MDLLKQLESKMQSLVQQRNQLKEELDALKAAGAAGDQELQSLRARLEEALAEKTALEKDREAVKTQVAAILQALEALG
ncbi:cell division protein ZapB [Geothrix campi]|jgi:regulator of replication initiation timing|uniref:cell division protein ZapB n=1 Tax=Geothrix campi TaxID=2966450 RepID=UPI0021499787|nr:cell division protein ZapB [Geothrix sp. SG10]